MIILTLFISKSRTGKAMRAVSEDKDAAELMGINVNRTISVTFAIGSALAAVAGLFYGMAYHYVGATHRRHARHQGLRGGGIRRHRLHPRAPCWAAFCWASSKSWPRRYISTELSDAIVFGVLILVLIVKPTGLLGKKISEKV